MARARWETADLAHQPQNGRPPAQECRLPVNLERQLPEAYSPHRARTQLSGTRWHLVWVLRRGSRKKLELSCWVSLGSGWRIMANTGISGSSTTPTTAADDPFSAPDPRKFAANHIPNILPHERVFPIQIGSELFKLSGASISSDGASLSQTPTRNLIDACQHLHTFPNTSSARSTKPKPRAKTLALPSARSTSTVTP